MEQPHVVFNEELKRWIVERYRFTGFGVHVEIPENFKTDLASIPRPLWPLIAPFELSILAPVVHDYLYQNKGKCVNKVLSRREVDGLFNSLMIALKIPAWKQMIAYITVRLFGWKRWGVCHKQ